MLYIVRNVTPLSRNRAEVGAGGGGGGGGGGVGWGGGGFTPPPPPHFFARIKINLTKNNLTKKFSFTHSSLAPPLVNLPRGPC